MTDQFEGQQDSSAFKNRSNGSSILIFKALEYKIYRYQRPLIAVYDYLVMYIYSLITFT